MRAINGEQKEEEKIMTNPLKDHKIVSEEKWIEARKSLLKKEKEFTALRGQLNEQRRELPWKAVNKQYLFEGSKGKETLAELFDGRSQLVVYGIDMLNVAYHYLDLVPKGRDEEGHEFHQFWVRRHDKYG